MGDVCRCIYRKEMGLTTKNKGSGQKRRVHSLIFHTKTKKENKMKRERKDRLEIINFFASKGVKVRNLTPRITREAIKTIAEDYGMLNKNDEEAVFELLEVLLTPNIKPRSKKYRILSRLAELWEAYESKQKGEQEQNNRKKSKKQAKREKKQKLIEYKKQHLLIKNKEK